MLKKIGVVTLGVAASLAAVAPMASAHEASPSHGSHSSEATCSPTGGNAKNENVSVVRTADAAAAGAAAAAPGSSSSSSSAAAAAGDAALDNVTTQMTGNTGNITCSKVASPTINM